ncbi:hypothetical protein ACFY1L_09625 [Streptomyces sp. NPDC001663]|uniref:hypothetical protein n=1 Tax=Streptomyces sp. NPDC001663 TaxID=3364597 RepID=UPI0036780572
MEQRIGSSSQPLKGEPVKGAGFDPAFIPGLTSPASEEPEEVTAEDGDVESEDAESQDVRSEEVVSGAAEAEADAEAGEQDASADGDDEEEAPEGPVFEASDRRAKIVADHKGVRLALDDQECEFRWDEIGAVETESARFGKRFTITVHTPDRRWYPIEIEATARARFSEWEEQLDAVLDAYFDDDADDRAAEDADEGDE